MNTDWLEQNRPALASAITSLAWVADGIDSAERHVVQGLVDIEALFGANSTPILANKPWVTDGLDGHEITIVEQLSTLDESAKDAARQLISLSFLDTVEAEDTYALEILSGLASHEPALFSAVLAHPLIEDGLDEAEVLLLQKLKTFSDRDRTIDLWVATFAASYGPESIGENSLIARYDIDGSGAIGHDEVLLAVTDYSNSEITDYEFTHIVALYAFSEALIRTPQLMELAMATRWYRDGIDKDKYYTEARAVRALEKISNNNPELAKRIVGWPWIFDDKLATNEALVLEYLGVVDQKAPELTHFIVDLPWLADSIEPWETEAMSSLSELVTWDRLEYAVELASLPWVMDGVTDLEVGFGINTLTWAAYDENFGPADPQVARRIAGLVGNPPDFLDLKLIHSMGTLFGRSVFNAKTGMTERNPDRLSRLWTEPWFLDGLDTKERIYLIAAAGAGGERLYDPYTIATKSIELPLTGPINLWVVGHHEFHAQNSLSTMERAVRESEEFWQIPFPIEHVILYVWDSGKRGRHIGFMMFLSTYDGRVPQRTMFHEVAHYYFHEGPKWFTEGGANVVESYTFHDGNLPDPEFPDYCAEHGLKNLQDWTELEGGNLWDSCSYPMGQHFLLTLREVMGEHPWLSALRAFYLEYAQGSLHYRARLTSDEDVYRVFLEHTPPDLVEDVKDVFHRFHGGPFIDQEG